jgi:hypothetical protein
MPTLEEALAGVFDAPAEPAASDPAVATTAENEPVETPTETATAAEGETPPAETAAAPETQAATPSTTDAPSVEDLQAIKARFAEDHPELAPVMNAALKEMERGLQRKFEQVAALKKQTAEQIIREERLQAIPQDELLQMAEWHRLAQSNPEAAADRLFAASEQLRQQAQHPNTNTTPYSQLPPELAAELQQMRGFYHQQTQQQVAQQIEGQFTALSSEFGSQPIPENQRIHVLETIQQRGLGVDDIPLMWKALYGVDHARQEALKKGQAMRQQKAGLSAGATAAPPPASANRPKTLEDALAEVCSAHGVR